MVMTRVLFECLTAVFAVVNAVIEIYVHSWVTKPLVATITVNNAIFDKNRRLFLDELDSRIGID